MKKTNITEFAKQMHDPEKFKKDLEDIYSRIHIFNLLYGGVGWEALKQMMKDDAKEDSCK